MYILNEEDKSLSNVDGTTFKAKNYKERFDLQEWIVKTPDFFGENLLIIQKEFDKFDDTKERLDVLALDKNGTLVIIENKIDNDAKDTVWQALKYASYCSTLKPADIVSIFNDYLKRYNIPGTAEDKLKEFYGDNEDDYLANLNTKQVRIILVAPIFRKEVTSTVLWLLDKIDIKCFQVSLYKLNGKILVDVDQIIPLQDESDYQIRLARKQADDISRKETMSKRDNIRHKFWQQLKDEMDKKNEFLVNCTPGKDNWMSFGIGFSGVSVCLIIAHQSPSVRCALTLNKKADFNKKAFDFLCSKKDEIERNFGDRLEWLKNDDGVAQIVYKTTEYDYYDEETWPAINEFFIRYSKKMYDAFKKPVQDLKEYMKAE